MMKLYYDEVMSPRKACAVARHLGSPVEFVRVRLGQGEHRAPSYLAMNPNGKVPTLVDGDRTLWEANAIMAHLAIKAGSNIWPNDERQIDVMRWLSWDSQHFIRATGALYFEHVIRDMFNLGAPDKAAVEGATKEFHSLAAILDDHLTGRTFLVGDALTIADFAVAITFPYADEARIPLHEFPQVKRWHDRLNQLEAWRDPFPAPVVAAA